MAKTEVFESDQTVMAKVMELKKELQKLVRIIVDEEDYGAEAVDRAQEALVALKEIGNKKRSMSLKLHDALPCPDEFRCPLSKELMRDPVILASGQTYDRAFIQQWLNSGNRTCPITQQVLSQIVLTPNHLIRDMICKWCKSQGYELPKDDYSNEEGITEADRSHFFYLLDKMSASLPEQKSAAKELRLLTKRMPSFRALFGESTASILQLLTPLCNSQSGIQSDLQEDVITTLLNLSIHDSNKKLVCETPSVMPVLLEALKSGTVETRSNAAAALFTLSALDSNKSLIGKAGAMRPLIDLLEEGHPLAIKDVASAIFNLCIIHENRARAVRDDAVRVIVMKISEGSHVDELLAVLAMLSTHSRALEEMGSLCAVNCLLRIIRENNCERNKENAIAILHSIFFSDRSTWKDIREEENSYGTISKLIQEGTSRAKRKASGILDRLKRSVKMTHTA